MNKFKNIHTVFSMAMPLGWNSNLGQEQVIWKNEVMTGIINRRVVETQIITNFRVSQNESSISLSDLDEIIVMNSHRESERSGYYYRHMSYGTGRGKTVGDVVFLRGGQPLIVFKQISDPNGVCRLAKTARRSVLTSIKQAQKQEEKLRKEQEKEMKQSPKMRPKQSGTKTVTVALLDTNSGTKRITCMGCGNSNPTNSNFCLTCGKKLSSACSKCGHSSPSGSAFCNNCGFALA